jgi:hypothetical protein
LQLLLLRPAWFFENVESQLEQIGAEGVLAGSIESELAMPMVGTADIADAAVAGLRSQAVGVQELLGPQDLDHRRVARELGRAFGRTEARYVRVPDDAMAGQLVGAGVSASFADLFVEMTRAINAQRLQPLGGRTDANTTPTSFAAYATRIQRAASAVDAEGCCLQCRASGRARSRRCVGPTRRSISSCRPLPQPSMNISSPTTNIGPTSRPTRSSTKAGLRPS